jgi:alkylation response protein AidB-like acyl-CoA dehydrogenase
VTTAQIPSAGELTGRAAGLVPLLRKHAEWADENRRLHDEVVEALADAGVLRMRVPLRYGGFESPATALVDVATELGRGDGSAAWTASVWWIPTWMAGLFPDDVQDEVFATPNVRVCGTLSPGGLAVPAAGGLVVNGRWGFISGAWHSHWQEIIAIAPAPDGEAQQPVMALVPMSELEIVDDWHTSGVRGSGSVSTVARDVFVPQERVLPLMDVLQQRYASKLNAGSPVYRVPLNPYAAAASVGTMLGLARGARENFFGRLPDRKITYTDYPSQREAPVTHLQVARAALKTDQAGFHAYRVAGMVDAKSQVGEDWTTQERAQARADVAAVSELAVAAVDELATASGATSLYRHVPIQRITRDLRAVSQHALIYPPTAYELYGRVLCGLEPNTSYV